MTRTITVWFCVAVTLAVIVYDVVIAIEPTPGDTVSKVAQGIFKDYPVIAFAMGGLGGHVTSTLLQYLPSWWYYASLPMLGAVVIALGVLSAYRVVPLPNWPAVWAQAGFAVAFVLWPQ